MLGDELEAGGRECHCRPVWNRLARMTEVPGSMTELIWEREWPARVSILVLAFAGYFDAANAATGAIDHLIEHTDATRLATIDGDAFFDAQQVRPHVVLEDGVTRTIVWPENTAYANDEAAAGRELVLLSGIEPHYHWRRFTDLLIEIAEHTGAQVVITLGAMPAQVPHSRMPLVHASSANPELAKRFGLHRPRYQGITGIVGALQAELDARGLPAISMQVGVPYYAAGAPNWKAAAAGELESATEALAREMGKLENLQGALASRQVIGRAEGILMHRERITADEAFDLLRHASQNLNTKLRDVAQYVVDTGEVPQPHHENS
jgi:predicted ATP-grasp superfamily ATP-dependent carboligase